MIDGVGTVILGMGRSGTSAVAGMFVAAGFFSGRDDDVLLANKWNARGHHENLGIMEQNERIVGDLGGTWYLAAPLDRQLTVLDRVVPVLRGEVKRMAHESGGTPIVVKDPRIGAMLPLWNPVIADHLHPVLVVRHPIEVARSLLRRDNTPHPYGLAIWEHYTTFLLENINGWLVTVAPYARLLEDPDLDEEIVATVANHIEPSRAHHVLSHRAASVLDSSLRHNTHDPKDEAELLTGRQRELWAWLDSLPPGDQTIAAPRHLRSPSAYALSIARLELDRVSIGFDRARLAREVEEERKRSAKLEARLTREVEEERARCARLEAELHGLRAAYVTVITSRRWRVMGPPAGFVRAVRRLRRPL